MLAKERKVTSRSRHITRRYLKVREYVADGIIAVRRVPTDDNTADIFTKPLTHWACLPPPPRHPFWYLRCI
eukprot:scaffold2899_cov106-Isochrysis_galbana.AAC.4